MKTGAPSLLRIPVVIAFREAMSVATAELFLTFDDKLCRLFNLASRRRRPASKRAGVLFISCGDQQNSIVSFMDHLKTKTSFRYLVQCSIILGTILVGLNSETRVLPNCGFNSGTS